MYTYILEKYNQIYEQLHNMFEWFAFRISPISDKDSDSGDNLEYEDTNNTEITILLAQ